MKYAISRAAGDLGETLFLFERDSYFREWAEYGHDARDRGASPYPFQYLEISAEAFEALRDGRDMIRYEWPELTAYGLDLDEAEDLEEDPDADNWRWAL